MPKITAISSESSVVLFTPVWRSNIANAPFVTVLVIMSYKLARGKVWINSITRVFREAINGLRVAIASRDGGMESCELIRDLDQVSWRPFYKLFHLVSREACSLYLYMHPGPPRVRPFSNLSKNFVTFVLRSLFICHCLQFSARSSGRAFCLQLEDISFMATW